MGILEKLSLACLLRYAKRKIKELKKMADAESKRWFLSKQLWNGVFEAVICLLVLAGVACESLKVEAGPLAEAVIALFGSIMGLGLVIQRIRGKFKRLTK